MKLTFEQFRRNLAIYAERRRTILLADKKHRKQMDDLNAETKLDRQVDKIIGPVDEETV